MYSMDFEDWIIPERQAADTASYWFRILGGADDGQGYGGLRHFVLANGNADVSKQDSDSFSCPGESLNFGNAKETSYTTTHYIINRCLTGHALQTDEKYTYARKTVMVKNPSQTLLVGDSGITNGTGCFKIAQFSYRHGKGDPRNRYDGHTIQPTLSGRTNILHVGGNTSQMTYAELLALRDKSIPDHGTASNCRNHCGKYRNRSCLPGQIPISSWCRKIPWNMSRWGGTASTLRYAGKDSPFTPANRGKQPEPIASVMNFRSETESCRQDVSLSVPQNSKAAIWRSRIRDMSFHPIMS